MSISILAFAIVLVLLAAAVFHIWQTRKRVRLMLETVRTFDLGNFEERLVAAGRGGGDLAALAVEVAGLTGALFSGASTVTSSASTTVAEKEAETQQTKLLCAQRVAGVINRIAASMAQIETAAMTMSAAANDTQTCSAEMVARLHDAASNVTAVAEACEQLSASITDAGSAAAQTAAKADSAAQQTVQANALIEELSRSAQSIGEVVTIINGIARRSNMLALNATIEAARAGVSGTAFAAVAREVKAFAGQTVKATEDIRKQIVGIQAATSAAVSAVSTIGAEIGELDRFTAAMRSSVDKQCEATRDIAAFAQSATKATGDLRGRILTVDDAIRANNVAAREIQQGASHLCTEVKTLSGETLTACPVP
jgi:methyl-accepting chemotaxis protein